MPHGPDLERAVSVMTGFSGPWGIAGGLGIDLFLGRQSRPHADIDIAVLRADQRELRSHLGDCRLEKVLGQGLAPWAVDERLELPIHEAHATWFDGYHLEFLLNERDPRTDEWVFRRDARVRRSMAAALPGGQNIPYLAPEIVLLYKAKAASEKDEADFGVAVAHLSDEQRFWLAQVLNLTMPGHRWAGILSRDA